MSRRIGRDPQYQRRSPRKIQKRYEERGVVLDILTSESHRRDIDKGETRLQVLGATWFTILEVITEDDTQFMVQETISLSKDEGNKIKKIASRISYSKLTSIAERGLENAIDTILTNEEKRFVTWINQAEAISIRLHRLQLIKGIGPKFMTVILNERKDLPFISYEDFEERTKVKDIIGLLKQRILDEIKDEDIKYHLFTRAMRKPSQNRY